MAVAGSLTWGQSTGEVFENGTVTIPITSDSDKNEIPALVSGDIAEIVSSTFTEIVIRGKSAGTLNIPADTAWIESNPAFDMNTTNAFTLTVKADEPRVATQSMWADLAGKVNEKAIITMTSTDPGEGGILEANHFIAVYSQ